MLTTGEAAKAERDALERAGKPVPDRLRMPDILPGCDEYLAAFFELSSDRQIGMAPGPLPAASIARHVQGWDQTEAERFRQVMRALDAVFLAERPTDGKPKPKVVGVLTPGVMQERFGQPRP